MLEWGPKINGITLIPVFQELGNETSEIWGKGDASSDAEYHHFSI